MRKIKKVEERKIDVFVNYVLSEDEDTKFVLYTELEGEVGSFENHYEVLDVVKGLSLNKELKVYDDTYEVKYILNNLNIVGELEWPKYMEEYKDRYMETFDGVYKEELIYYKEEEELKLV